MKTIKHSRNKRDTRSRVTLLVALTVLCGKVASGLLSRVRSNVYDNVPLAQAGKPFPLILFSHGLGQSPFNYAIQLEELASHGYVVVAISHIGDAPAVLLPGGVAVPYDAAAWEGPPPDSPAAAGIYDAHQRLFAEDLVFTLDRMAGLSQDAQSQFNGMLDLNRIGAFGLV